MKGNSAELLGNKYELWIPKSGIAQPLLNILIKRYQNTDIIPSIFSQMIRLLMLMLRMQNYSAMIPFLQGRTKLLVRSVYFIYVGWRTFGTKVFYSCAFSYLLWYRMSSLRKVELSIHKQHCYCRAAKGLEGNMTSLIPASVSTSGIEEFPGVLRFSRIILGN